MSTAVLNKYELMGAFEGETPQETADRLHAEHNRPVQPPVRFAPYVYQPYPSVMYREWSADDRDREERKQAIAMGADLFNPREAALVARSIPPFDSCFVQSDADRDAHLENGWANTPAESNAAKMARQRDIARMAAERQFDDRRLGEAARAELERLDDASEAHLVDVPTADKKGRRQIAGKDVR